MKNLQILLSVASLLNSVGICQADNEEIPKRDFFSDLWQRETLADGYFGLNNQLSNSGVEVGLGVTQIYQQNARGGISTHRKAGRYSGSYDLELSIDLQQLLCAEACPEGSRGKGNLFIHGEGGWPNIEGIDEVSVGSALGVNADAIEKSIMDVVELYYEGPVFDNAFNLMIGKIDFTGIFDASTFADDETSQFLNGAFVDNPTIPFPDYSLGVVLSFDLNNSCYISGGIADAQANGRGTGFRTAFNGENYFFYVLETAVTAQLNSANGPTQGTYRLGLWYDPQPKVDSDSGRNYRDDVGFYLTCDQVLVKENAKPEDSQGLGALIRYGYASSKGNDITNFWSSGFQYQGLIEGRDNDVLGVGFAYGVFSDMASSTYYEDYESAVELYYNIQISPWLNVTPDVQYIANPGGAKGVSDAIIFGVRTQMRF
jgi:porin